MIGNGIGRRGAGRGFTQLETLEGRKTPTTRAWTTFSPVFYDKIRFKRLDCGIKALPWHSGPRAFTWVHLFDKRTGRSLLAVSLHFEFSFKDSQASNPPPPNAAMRREASGKIARDKSLDTLLQFLVDCHPDVPAVVAGDFNCYHRTQAEALRTGMQRAGFEDAHAGTSDTFKSRHGKDNYLYPERAREETQNPNRHCGRIDHIFARGFRICESSVHTKPVVTRHGYEQWPSDHYPILATLEFQ
ncbi:Endonuclease/exonuclease/phosphatase [Hyaloraphidium curvatum]|nr:Endonuclease/exonuclease/phosphatase [Hyaloraphidium curvatum]